MQFRSSCILHSATFATTLRPLRFCSHFRAKRKEFLLTAEFAEMTQSSRRIFCAIQIKLYLTLCDLCDNFAPSAVLLSFQSKEKRVFVNRGVRRNNAKFAEDLSCNSDYSATVTQYSVRELCVLFSF